MAAHDPAARRHGSHCLACGGRIEGPLASLGSLRCVGCRSDRRPLDPDLVRTLARPRALRRERI